MRILVAIPHYVGPPAPGGTVYGSSQPDAGPVRAAALARTIAGLAVHLGPSQARIGWAGPPPPDAPPVPAGSGRVRFQRANRGALPAALDIRVVVVEDRHVLDRVRLPPSAFQVERVTLDRLGGDPRMLGFACLDLLAAQAEGYDWIGYMEDDTVVGDPWFLRKIALLERASQGEAVLLPNRFEADPEGRYWKLYVDGPIPPRITAPWQDVGRHASMNLSHLGEPVVVERPTNPHAGCWFLSARQFARWRAQPHFADRRPLFIGPLESAATLGVMRTFRVYKPGLDCASFLEAEHLNNRVWIRPRSQA
ncbi:hypothetical protein [Stella sp.]|uniref:hypothetical protein n=1 Tax=Stella sp. TaxID=2912054 RepID=UPI0035B24F33